MGAAKTRRAAPALRACVLPGLPVVTLSASQPAVSSARRRVGHVMMTFRKNKNDEHRCPTDRHRWHQCESRSNLCASNNKNRDDKKVSDAGGRARIDGRETAVSRPANPCSSVSHAVAVARSARRRMAHICVYPCPSVVPARRLLCVFAPLREPSRVASASGFLKASECLNRRNAL